VNLEAEAQVAGTMLVLSSAAKEEATRLGKRSTLILPTPATKDIICASSAIDEAILLTLDMQLVFS
jgi:hypothetical protein